MRYNFIKVAKPILWFAKRCGILGVLQPSSCIYMHMFVNEILPVNEPVKFQLEGADVIHWILRAHDHAYGRRSRGRTVSRNRNF